MIEDKLTAAIIGAALRVHNALGVGFLEQVYENAQLVELSKTGLNCSQQHPIKVWYEGVLVGDFVADIQVEGTIILELKAVENLHSIHEAQLANYLEINGLDIGLLLNFGSSLEVKRKYRTYKKTNQ